MTYEIVTINLKEINLSTQETKIRTRNSWKQSNANEIFSYQFPQSSHWINIFTRKILAWTKREIIAINFLISWSTSTSVFLFLAEKRQFWCSCQINDMQQDNQNVFTEMTSSKDALWKLKSNEIYCCNVTGGNNPRKYAFQKNFRNRAIAPMSQNFL